MPTTLTYLAILQPFDLGCRFAFHFGAQFSRRTYRSNTVVHSFLTLKSQAYLRRQWHRTIASRTSVDHGVLCVLEATTRLTMSPTQSKTARRLVHNMIYSLENSIFSLCHYHRDNTEDSSIACGQTSQSIILRLTWLLHFECVA